MTQTQPYIDHAIVDALIINDDKFLLVEESKPGREGLYNLPGGHVDPYETLAETAIREAKEETGFDIELTGLVGVYQSVFPHINVSGAVFSAIVVGGSATATQEHPSVRWVTADELSTLAKNGKLFTTYPPIAVDHYLGRGVFPVEVVSSYKYLP